MKRFWRYFGIAFALFVVLTSPALLPGSYLMTHLAMPVTLLYVGGLVAASAMLALLLMFASRR